MSVKDGRLELPDGMSYRMLVLPEQGSMPCAGTATPALLTRIVELVVAGAIVLGPPPLRSPGLSNHPACDQELRTIVTRLWGDCDGKTVKEHRVGKGRVVWGDTPAQVLSAMGIPPDFSCDGGSAAPFRYTHRRMEDGTEIYFVANRQDAEHEAICTFRVSGKRPEFWWPETGQTEKSAIFDETGGCTTVPIRLTGNGSVFVIFRPSDGTVANRFISVTRNGKMLTNQGEYLGITTGTDTVFEAQVRRSGTYVLKTSNQKTCQFSVVRLPEPLEITGSWTVRFPPNSGAPEETKLEELMSLSEHPNSGIRYFSGKATYRKTIKVPSELLAEVRLIHLDLGNVQVIAEVKVNGMDFGILWRPPYRIDITRALQPGDNVLEVNVVNLWPNRLIGDEQLPEDCRWGKGNSEEGQPLVEWPAWILDDKPSPAGRIAFTTWKLWCKDSPLPKSGLLGPVTLHATARVSFAVEKQVTRGRRA